MSETRYRSMGRDYITFRLTAGTHLVVQLASHADVAHMVRIYHETPLRGDQITYAAYYIDEPVSVRTAIARAIRHYRTGGES